MIWASSLKRERESVRVCVCVCVCVCELTRKQIVLIDRIYELEQV